jgi:hypothetical protein
VRSRGVLLALLAAGAGAVLLRRRTVSRGEHVDLYYDDGSMVSLDAGSAAAERMLGVAREALGRLPVS